MSIFPSAYRVIWEEAFLQAYHFDGFVPGHNGFDPHACWECCRAVEEHHRSTMLSSYFREPIRSLQEYIHAMALSKGWYEGEPRTFGDHVALLHSEVSEALEEYRRGVAVDYVYVGDDGKPEGVPIELADVFIRLLDTAEALNIDLVGAIAQKLEYNADRPHRHGGKKL